MFNFPWSNFHELNLDWILSVVKEAKEIFVKGEGDIQHAVETADQALETAEQAAAGVIADGAVTIPKLNSEVYSLFAYCVSGSVAPDFIPAGALVILRKSTIYNVTDGIYTATRNIPQNAIITAADLDQSATLYREGGMNYLLHNEEKLSGTIDLIKAGLVILVTGDEASAAVPADGLAYVTNNTHGLTEGFYFNSSGATFPPTGGTADSDSFTAVNNILNALQSALDALGSDDISNDSTVTGVSVTDALDNLNNSQDNLNDALNTVDGLSGKKILIIGDSISDEALFPNCWVKDFKEMCTAIGATVTNYSLQGRTIGRYSGATNYLMNVLSGIPAGSYDEILVFLGANDWGNQVDLGYYDDSNLNSFCNNIKQFYNWKRQNQSAAKVTFITPLKTHVENDLRHKLMQFYAAAMASICTFVGFGLIDAHSFAPLLSSADITDWTIDGVHPRDSYSPYLARFIFNNLLSRVSSNGSDSITTNLAIGDVGGRSNTITFQYSGNGACSYSVRNYSISGSGTIKIADLPEECQTTLPVYGIGQISVVGVVYPVTLISTGSALYCVKPDSVPDGVLAGEFSIGHVRFIKTVSSTY